MISFNHLRGKNRGAGFFLLLSFVIIFGSCTEKVADSPHGNKPPTTFLWLFPDSTVGVGVSRTHLRWWGEDPDGVIRGYLFAYAVFPSKVSTIPDPDPFRYAFVSRTDTIMQFPLDTLFRNYTVVVRAVDNTFKGLPDRSIIRFSPNPYWDKNDNGLFDAGDELLHDLPGATDPRGAVQTFPIRNTPPRIVFAQNPNDGSIALKQPDTTYTVATFAFKGSDADGDNTLASYRIALNDTSSPSRWLTIPLRDTVVTLVVPRTRSDGAGAEVDADVYGGRFLGRQLLGRLSGLRLDAQNVLYVQAKDVAGEFSPAIRMPSGTNQWFVKKPRGKMLMVIDDIGYGITADTAYRNALAKVPGGLFSTIDHLDIGRGLVPADKANGRFGPQVPPFVDPALVNTFLLYDYVFWYTEQYPSLGVAQLSLFTYIQNGGKVIFSTTFQNSIDPRGALRDFAPIDSVSSAPFTPRPAPGDTRVPASYKVYADSSDPTNIYPQLAFNPGPPALHSVFMRPIYRRSDAKYLYNLQPDTANTPPRYIGRPNVAVIDGQKRIVFIGLPLHLLNNTVVGNPLGIGAFFTKILTLEFSPAHKIDRRKF